MSDTRHPAKPEIDTWLSVRQLAASEGVTKRQVYWAIDQGLQHSRIGQRIRLRRRDWHQFHEQHLVNATPAAGRKGAA
jgi:hypothetical protein